MPTTGRGTLSTASTGVGESDHEPHAPTSLPGIPSSPGGKMDDGIRRFIPDDSIVRLEQRGDLDSDGDSDLLVVLQKRTPDKSSPRSLVILRAAADGSFEKIVDNPNAILCQSCGGMIGDPLSDVTITPGGFVITFEGGSRELWSRQYAFAYSKFEDNWQLESIDKKMSDRISGHQEEKRTTRNKIGSVLIEDFNAALIAQES